MSSGKGMLIAAPERWDEACFSVPAIRALVRSGLVGGLVCREEQEAFWKSVCDLPQFLLGEKTRVGAFAKELGDGWEASLVWEKGLPAKAFSKAGISKRLGPSCAGLGKLLTHAMEISEEPTVHRVRFYLNSASEMGIAVDRHEFFEPAEMGISPAQGSILLCPDSDFGVSYEWPLARWQELSEKLIKQSKSIAIACLGGGRSLGTQLAEKLGDQAEAIAPISFGTSLPLLASKQIVVAADGSLPHLAAHAGATCVTLFGPNDAVWKRPLGKRHQVVKRHVECSPCLSAKCLMDDRCQNELDVAAVLAGISKIS